MVKFFTLLLDNYIYVTFLFVCVTSPSTSRVHSFFFPLYLPASCYTPPHLPREVNTSDHPSPLQMYQSIRPGGKLVLECQHWKGYGRRKKLTPAIYKNYQEIRILPHEFPQYLQTIGFTKWRTLGVPSHSQKGETAIV